MTRFYLFTRPVPATVAANPGSAFTAGTGSLQLVAANLARVSLEVWNLDPVAVVFGALAPGPAALNAGFVLEPNGGYWSLPQDSGGIPFTGAVYVISTAANTPLSLVEV